MKTAYCDQCGTELLWPAPLCGFCEEENRRMQLNEERADRGMRAVEAASHQPHILMENPVVSDIEDTLAYIAHSCDRFGLDAHSMFRDGLRLYRRHLKEDGPRVAHLADGDHLTITEARNQCQQSDSPKENVLS